MFNCGHDWSFLTQVVIILLGLPTWFWHLSGLLNCGLPPLSAPTLTSSRWRLLFTVIIIPFILHICLMVAPLPLRNNILCEANIVVTITVIHIFKFKIHDSAKPESSLLNSCPCVTPPRHVQPIFVDEQKWTPQFPFGLWRHLPRNRDRHLTLSLSL